MTDFRGFPFESVGDLTTAMLRRVYESARFVPSASPEIQAIPEEGEGIGGLADVFQSIVQGSAGLAAPGAMGHMDTAPHPAAAFAEALVCAANNNLLFRELSPLASRVEERLLDELAARLGLSEQWAGTFVSGGSLANLTALFAAVGGFDDAAGRAQCALFVPECAHVSVKKSAAVLGIPAERVRDVGGDELGRAHPSELEEALRGSSARRKVVIATLGSTVHGAVENIEALARVCSANDAWLHVDAIYGGGLAFSQRYRHLLAGLDAADSVALGPQKWMYVPRLSAIVWVKGRERFERALGTQLPYSATGEPHRGRWGLQGSRRADALTLWAVLRYVGAKSLGMEIDRTIDLAKAFWSLLSKDAELTPTHGPDLNVLCFRYRSREDVALPRAHRALGIGDVPWVSLSRWRGRPLFRAVLLSPATSEAHLSRLVEALRRV